MSELIIRQAILDDTGAISQLFKARIDVWQRISPQGQVESVPYEALTIYERWLHGGAWMSVETAAVYLSHLIRVECIALVAMQDDNVVGYAEAYPGSEPAPYGKHLHLGSIATHFENAPETHNALMQYLRDYAKQLKLERLTVSFSAYNAEAATFYQKQNFKQIERIQRYALPAHTGQTFYKAVEHEDPNSAQINGWYMSAGRQESARLHWEQIWARLWDAVPEITARKTAYLKFNASGQEALIFCQQQLYDVRSADIYCWSPRPLTPQMLTAVRDWAHKQSYRNLFLDVPESAAKALGNDAEKNPQQQDIYAMNV